MSTNRICQFCIVGLAVCLLSTATVRPAQAQQGLGERLGEQLDQGLNRLRSEVREGWASLRSTVDKMGVQGRVYGRLRWDKQLAESRIDVETEEGGVVLLRGQVSSAAAQQKALQLANDTVGVNKVVDELKVMAPGDNPVRPSEAPEE